jgi:hypothetical protein
VAVVGDLALTQERLVELLDRVGESRAGPYAVADAVAQGWLDLALVAEAARAGIAPRELQDEALESAARTGTLERLQNLRAARGEPLTEGELRRAFEGDSLRLFQRILVRLGDPGNPLEVEVKRARADSVVALARAGAPFDELASRFSEGRERTRGGYLEVVTRAQTPEAFRDALWSLEPGDVSPAVQIDEGFLLFRRPPLDEARTRLSAWILRKRMARADSIFVDSLTTTAELRLLPSTLRDLRALLANPDSLADDSTQLVGFVDGGLTSAEAWLWLATLPDAARLSLARASDAEIERAARSMGTNELLYRKARSLGLAVTADEMAEAREAFATATESLFRRFSGPAGPAPGALVDSMVSRAIAGEADFVLPPGLAPALRRRIPHRLERPALAAASRRASSSFRADGSNPD